MSTSTDINLEILDDLDFEAACEYSGHHEISVADRPADYLVRSSCLNCPQKWEYLICHDCYFVIMRAMLRCPACKQYDEGWKSIIILRTLR